jgi:hypothetical protein
VVSRFSAAIIAIAMDAIAPLRLSKGSSESAAHRIGIPQAIEHVFDGQGIGVP